MDDIQDAIIEEESPTPDHEWPTSDGEWPKNIDSSTSTYQNTPGCMLYDPHTNKYTSLQPFTTNRKIIEDEFIEMKFLETYTSTPLTEDGGVIKYTDPNFVPKDEGIKSQDEKGIEESDEEESPFPESLARVRIRYEGRKENGELLDKQRDRKQLKAFRLFQDTMITGIHYAARSLRKGETGWFKFTPEYHYGPKGAPPFVEENATLFYKVELADFSNPKKQLANDDYDGRVEILNDSREKGNAAFSNQEYERAFKEYKRGAETVKNFPKALYATLDNEKKELLRDFQIKLANNALLMCIKRKAYKEGLQYADVVLNTDPKNSKAIFRRGQCLMELDYLDSAIKSYNECIEIEGGSKECERLIEVCQKRKEIRLKNEKKTYKHVWDKMAEAEEEEEKERKKREKIERKKMREAGMNEEILAPNPNNIVSVDQLLQGAIINTGIDTRAKVDISTFSN